MLRAWTVKSDGISKAAEYVILPRFMICICFYIRIGKSFDMPNILYMRVFGFTSYDG